MPPSPRARSTRRVRPRPSRAPIRRRAVRGRLRSPRRWPRRGSRRRGRQAVRHLGCARAADVSASASFLGQPSFRLGQPSAGGLRFGLTRRFGAPQRGQLLAPGLRCRSQGRELGHRLGQGSLGLGRRALEVEVAGRDRGGHPSSCRLGIRLGRGALVGEADRGRGRVPRDPPSIGRRGPGARSASRG